MSGSDERGPAITGHVLKVVRKPQDMGFKTGEDAVTRFVAYSGGEAQGDEDALKRSIAGYERSLCFNPLAYVKTDEDARKLAEWLIGTAGEVEHDVSSAEAASALFESLVILLRDWFKDEYYSLSGVLTLLSMAAVCEDGRDFKSALDLVFLQIERGVKYVKAPGDAEYSWQPSDFRRKSDGVQPADCGGLAVEQDAALRRYEVFRSMGVEDKKAALALCCECMSRVADLAQGSFAEICGFGSAGE